MKGMLLFLSGLIDLVVHSYCPVQQFQERFYWSIWLFLNCESLSSSDNPRCQHLLRLLLWSSFSSGPSSIPLTVRPFVLVRLVLFDWRIWIGPYKYILLPASWDSDPKFLHPKQCTGISSSHTLPVRWKWSWMRNRIACIFSDNICLSHYVF